MSIIAANTRVTKPTAPHDPQQTLWLRTAKNGDKSAFSHIVKQYQQPITNFCYRMLHTQDEAEDAAQEIFLRAYTKLDSYNEQHKFSTWLFSIASHYCIDKLRKRRFQLVSWDDLAPWYQLPHQAISHPEKMVIKTETSQEVQSLLNSLPADYQTAIILKYWHTQSYQEIAQTLDTTVSAVKSKLFRAKKLMAKRAQRAAAHKNKPIVKPLALAIG